MSKLHRFTVFVTDYPSQFEKHRRATWNIFIGEFTIIAENETRAEAGVLDLVKEPNRDAAWSWTVKAYPTDGGFVYRTATNECATNLEHFREWVGIPDE